MSVENFDTCPKSNRENLNIQKIDFADNLDFDNNNFLSTEPYKQPLNKFKFPSDMNKSDDQLEQNQLKEGNDLKETKILKNLSGIPLRNSTIMSKSINQEENKNFRNFRKFRKLQIFPYIDYINFNSFWCIIASETCDENDKKEAELIAKKILLDYFDSLDQLISYVNRNSNSSIQYNKILLPTFKQILSVNDIPKDENKLLLFPIKYNSRNILKEIFKVRELIEFDKNKNKNKNKNKDGNGNKNENEDGDKSNIKIKIKITNNSELRDKGNQGECATKEANIQNKKETGATFNEKCNLINKMKKVGNNQEIHEIHEIQEMDPLKSYLFQTQNQNQNQLKIVPNSLFTITNSYKRPSIKDIAQEINLKIIKEAGKIDPKLRSCDIRKLTSNRFYKHLEMDTLFHFHTFEQNKPSFPNVTIYNTLNEENSEYNIMFKKKFKKIMKQKSTRNFNMYSTTTKEKEEYHAKEDLILNLLSKNVSMGFQTFQAGQDNNYNYKTEKYNNKDSYSKNSKNSKRKVNRKDNKTQFEFNRYNKEEGIKGTLSIGKLKEILKNDNGAKIYGSILSKIPTLKICNYKDSDHVRIAKIAKEYRIPINCMTNVVLNFYKLACKEKEEEITYKKALRFTSFGKLICVLIHSYVSGFSMKPEQVLNKLKHIFKINDSFLTFEDYLPIHLFYIDFKNPEFHGKFNWFITRVMSYSFLAGKRESKKSFFERISFLHV